MLTGLRSEREICGTDLKPCEFKSGGKGREPIGVAGPRGKLPVAMTTRGKGGGQGSGGPEHKSSVVRGAPLSTVKRRGYRLEDVVGRRHSIGFTRNIQSVTFFVVALVPPPCQS